MNEPTVKKKARIVTPKSKATASVLSEILFVFLPLLTMAIVFLAKKKISDIFGEAEWSFAAAVLSGQAIVKLSSVVASRGPAEGSYLALMLTGVVVLTLAPSLIVLTLVLTTRPVPIGLKVAQVILFSLALLIFFVLGVVGELIRRETYPPHSNQSEEGLIVSLSDG